MVNLLGLNYVEIRNVGGTGDSVDFVTVDTTGKVFLELEGVDHSKKIGALEGIELNLVESYLIAKIRGVIIVDLATSYGINGCIGSLEVVKEGTRKEV
ncbi:MAG: hypothetical protein OEL89_05550 [Candidatus Peregrinibacteria bacterium]|nr:hypothetical protein [Candidatus Peregrinibacteria bacterium]